MEEIKPLDFEHVDIEITEEFLDDNNQTKCKTIINSVSTGVPVKKEIKKIINEDGKVIREKLILFLKQDLQNNNQDFDEMLKSLKNNNSEFLKEKINILIDIVKNHNYSVNDNYDLTDKQIIKKQESLLNIFYKPNFKNSFINICDFFELCNDELIHEKEIDEIKDAVFNLNENIK